MKGSIRSRTFLIRLCLIVYLASSNISSMIFSNELHLFAGGFPQIERPTSFYSTPWSMAFTVSICRRTQPSCSNSGKHNVFKNENLI